MNFNEHVATVKDENTFLDPIFVNFFGFDDLKVYSEVDDMGKLKEKLDESLFAFNNKPRQTKMDIVLF